MFDKTITALFLVLKALCFLMISNLYTAKFEVGAKVVEPLLWLSRNGEGVKGEVDAADVVPVVVVVEVFGYG